MFSFFGFISVVGGSIWTFCTVYHIKFDNEVIRKQFVMIRVKMPSIGGEFQILNDFRELIFCGPCGPCFSKFFHCFILVLWKDKLLSLTNLNLASADSHKTILKKSLFFNQQSTNIILRWIVYKMIFGPNIEYLDG